MAFLSYFYRTSIVLLSYFYRTSIVLLSYFYRTSIVPLSYLYRTSIVLMLGYFLPVLYKRKNIFQKKRLVDPQNPRVYGHSLPPGRSQRSPTSSTSSTRTRFQWRCLCARLNVSVGLFGELKRASVIADSNKKKSE